MPKPHNILLLLIVLATICGCGDKKVEVKDVPLAKVGNTFLYENDILGLIPTGLSQDDSLRLVKDYVEGWIRQMVILQVAEATLSPKDKDFRQQLEDYKRSLIIFRYESEIISQRLDTLVTEAEIVSYYNEYQRNFELKENIVKVLYVKVTPDTPDLPKLRRMMRSDEPDVLEELEDYCNAYAVNYFLDDQTWLYFNDLLKEIPIQTYNQEAFLQNNRFIEINAEPFQYFVRFLDFRIRESISPLSMEEENIRSIILNKRKITLIRELQQDLLKKAWEGNQIKVF